VDDAGPLAGDEVARHMPEAKEFSRRIGHPECGDGIGRGAYVGQVLVGREVGGGRAPRWPPRPRHSAA
jgi:hypothetical protein